MDSVRLDKWLWAARFFKTRALAVRACELGRVHLRDQPAKPAKEVRAGDVLRITTDSATFVVDVVGLSGMRGSAEIAQKLYAETEASVAARAAEREVRRLQPQAAWEREGRPTKRDRRDLTRLRGRG